eukprot:scaffold18144_cov130-Isochrysis_galbana.AAC.3
MCIVYVSCQFSTLNAHDTGTRNNKRSTQPRLTPHAPHTLTTLTLRPQRARQIPPTLTHCEPLDDFRSSFSLRPPIRGKAAPGVLVPWEEPPNPKGRCRHTG